MDKIKAIEHEQMKNVVPKLKVGNTVLQKVTNQESKYLKEQ